MTPLAIPLPGSWSVADALRAVRDDERPFALVGSWAGSRALVGSAPARVLRDAFPSAGPDQPAVTDGFVGGGWFGMLGFAMGRQVERLPPPPPRPAPLPDAAFGWYDHVLRLDRDGRWWFEALDDTPAARARMAVLVARLEAGAPERGWSLDGMTLHGGGAAAHRAAVAECVERIAAGELFQANLCLRLDGRLSGDAAEAFAAAAARLRPAYGAFLGLGDAAVLSFSPELFLRRTGRDVVTAPIKGTASRTGVAERDEAARAALAASAKDAAEHVMIVDLMRNDLGRVAAYGTVSAAPEPDVEAHPGVWHLVSRVRARLRDGVTDADLLRATFPPGSVTGAPKVQSLKVISELEGTGREAYTGAIGYVSPAAGLELNVAIRTLEVRGTEAWLGCGGGIVADSGPDAELREALDKARPIAAALGATVPDAAGERRRPVALSARARAAAGDVPVETWRRLRRPDPAGGLLETIAVQDGVAVAARRHLRRLAASAALVYGIELPRDLAARIEAVAAQAGEGRHRLRVVLGPGGAATVGVEPAAAAGGDVPDAELEVVTVTGGLGPHKWADRAALAGPRTPLVVDLDGAVLEAGFANVWAVEGERLVTPPADGRLLAGVTRERLLELAPHVFRAEPLDLDRLRRADGIVLTSTIRLGTPAGFGAATPRAREAAARIRELLAPAPAGAPAG
jgi:para-aminobenzoate synthetase/4-amino-4-deoxychorismate lyase